MIAWSLCSEASGAESQDRVAVLEAGQAQILVVADGAGGMAGGREAAEGVVSGLGDLRPSVRDAADPAFWSRALGEIDRAIAADPEAGETTAVATAVVQGTLVGASVGDSGAFLFSDDQFCDLTARQVAKPLLGSGQAHPSGFGPHPFEGTLVTASDGLFDHATVAAIWGLLGPLPLADIAASLVALVRLPSGALADDVCVLVARPR